MNKQSLLPENDFSRKIIHLDMDAFYASVEMRDHPELADKAVVVASDPRQHHGHGVITTANYRARKYGVGSAMPAMTALKKIPASELVFIEPNFNKYREVSDQIHQLMHQVTDKVEPISLDEAYLDVTKNKLGNLTAVELANWLQQQIFRQTGLTSSFGVSFNKFLAKMGSEYAKPFGKCIILPDEAIDFLARADIAKFPGIGKKTQEILRQQGINTGLDLQQIEPAQLLKQFKSFGYSLAKHAYGIDFSEVDGSRQRKSLGKERTYDPLIFDQAKASHELKHFAQDVSASLQKRQLKATTCVLKIRDQNFVTQTKRIKLKNATDDAQILFLAANDLLDSANDYLLAGVRLLGLTATGLVKEQYEQINLFDTQE